jgi:hypothetical protein
MTRIAKAGEPITTMSTNQAGPCHREGPTSSQYGDVDPANPAPTAITPTIARRQCQSRGFQ